MAEHLASLQTLKIALGVDLDDNEKDSQYDFALHAATDSIRNYTGRDFRPQRADRKYEPRKFPYDGSGFLDIDDCTDITGVWINGFKIDENAWDGQPFGGKPVYHYITLPPGIYGQGSPAMGFTRNADRIYRPIANDGAEVVALWGWPRVPFDVQQAAIWTAVALTESPRPFVSESIEGYSRSVGAAPASTIPERAKEALVPYVIQRV